ncbi:MAG: WecB/TagA/CpsF family glycosyltransferase [bacterium]|nr:WecB/TagA/CpsF family glycosyltransferase [bacterium]
MGKTEIFGVKFDDLSMNEALEKIQGFVVLPYSEFIVRAQKDEEFKNILNSADFCLCEGRGLYLMARLIGKKLKQNIYGVDLIYNLNSKFKIQNSKLFLFGGTEDVVKKTAEKLGDSIIGYEHGYQDANRVVDKINLVKPDVLLVGLGSPKQEKFIHENLKKMPSVKLAIGVGGAFDFISGRIKRAPKFIQKISLEWLWRLIVEPKRIERVFGGFFGLSALVIKEKFFR